MTVPRLDSLFYRPRPVHVVLQKFFVVIGLDHKRLHLAQALDNQFRHVTEIGDKSETAQAGVKGEAQRINRVVRHGERLHRDIANRKLGAGRKDVPIAMPLD